MSNNAPPCKFCAYPYVPNLGEPEFKNVVDQLCALAPKPISTGIFSDAKPFDPCVALFPSPPGPGPQYGPQYIIPFHRQLIVSRVLNPYPDPDLPPPPPLSLACLDVKADIYLAFSLSLKQTWNLAGLVLGDLASTIALAPGEQLTLEFQTSQRRVLSQTTVDQAEQMNSLESTTSDKEALTAVHTASTTENWHVDANGKFGVGNSLGFNADFSKNVTNTSQSTINHVHESTIKSSHTLKTLHKVEVKGVTEAIVQNRMTRVITNPYKDRTLSVNVFQLLKHFYLRTELDQVNLALVIPITGITFDRDFVVANRDFLNMKLLDSNILAELPAAIAGAELTPADAYAQAEAVAELALRYLFQGPKTGGPNVFNMQQWDWNMQVFYLEKEPPPSFNPQLPGPPPKITGSPPTAKLIEPFDPNEPSYSFDETLLQDAFTEAKLTKNTSTQLAFMQLNLLFRVWQEVQSMSPSSTLSVTQLDVAKMILKDVATNWQAISNGQDISDLAGDLHVNEIFRRLPGVLTLMQNVLQPLLDQVTDDVKQNASALARLLKHLNCNANYYLQQYLAYTDSITAHQAIVDFASQVLDALASALPTPPSTTPTTPTPTQCLYNIFDADRAFVDRQQIVIPSTPDLITYNPDGSLTDSALVAVVNSLSSPNNPVSGSLIASLVPQQDEVYLPSDGIHLEAVAGTCVLSDLPPAPSPTVDLSVGQLEFKVGT
jgi:hypothetical protein